MSNSKTRPSFSRISTDRRLAPDSNIGFSITPTKGAWTAIYRGKLKAMFLICCCLLLFGVFIVFNYSKNANVGLRMDCNIFDDFGTFNMLTKYRPSDPYLLQTYFERSKKHMETV